MADTIPAALRAAADAYGDLTAVAEPGGPLLTYRDLHERVREVARALIASGIAAHDRVAIWSPNTHHWILAALGAHYAGATIVPVNTRFTGPEALDVITRSEARALFVAEEFLGADRLALVAKAAAQAGALAGAELPGLIVTIPVQASTPLASTPLASISQAPTRQAAASPHALGWAQFLARADAATQAAAQERADAVAPSDVSDILFTSGTTGRSKGAMSAHRQALDVARAWAECAELTSADKYLIVNPFFHSFGYKAGILACLLTGAMIVPQLVFDAGQAMELIESERITVFPGAPTIYVSILDHPQRDSRDLSSLRLAVTGAAVVPVALVERMRAELSFDAVLTAYGLTEAVVVTMCRTGDHAETVATTSGRATAGFEIAIASAGPGGGHADVGETGEILLRGPNVMLGYLDDQAATAAAIDAAGWLHTGDVGHLDERGYLAITDRLKDMYICGGFNVYPAEVEQALARHPAVAECVVIGAPDERLGEVGKAFVVLRPSGQAPSGQAPSDYATSAQDLIEFCKERLANYKIPRQIEFRAELPRNASGKALKWLLRQES